MTQDKIDCPYGLWPSLITPQMMGASLRLEDVQWDSDGKTLVWLEGRSGKGTLVCQQQPEAPRDLTVEHNVSGGIGYGGGEFTVSKGRIFFAAKDGRIYTRSLDYGAPTPLTPPLGGCASPALSPDGQWLIYINSFEGEDILALVDAQGDRFPIKLAQGADFYMQPVWHPSGKQLAWVEWDHPNMPWDDTRLVLADLKGTPPAVDRKAVIAGGDGSGVFQPAFSPDGRWLSYILCDEEWDKLCIRDLSNGEIKVLLSGAVISEPAWAQGMRMYNWSHDSQRIYYLRNDKGFMSLWQLDIQTGQSTRIDTQPYTWINNLSVSPTRDKLAFIASSSGIPARIVTWENGSLLIHKRSSAEMIDPADLPAAQPMQWDGKDRATIYGLYFPPTNNRFTSKGKPPAIVIPHGGPTGQTCASYLAETAFFANRGYAILHVNYRGSTGYGRSYMRALRGEWGNLDVEDTVSGARALVEAGLADVNRLIIKGSSSGGYTVMNALVRYPGIFKAAICLYGISNLFTITDTHKFEAHYQDSLVGTLPEAADKYRAWSPVYHAGQIRDMLAIFHGTEDKAVPIAQSEAIVVALKNNHVPHFYRVYEGEGHGWRKAETITAYYTEVENFLREFVLFSPPTNL